MNQRISRRKVLWFMLTSIVGSIALALSSNARLRRYIDQAAIHLSLKPPAPMPPVVSRTEWGAREPDHTAPNEFGFAENAILPEWYIYQQDLAVVYNTIAIHHSASLLASNETMKDIQDLHMDRNGWADVGYHFGIDQYGVIFAGRDINVRGASVAGYNTGTIGIVVMGNFETDKPLEVQITTLQSLINALTVRYNLTHLAGHGEFNPESVCPGRNLIPYLDQLAQAASLERGTSGHIPPTL